MSIEEILLYYFKLGFTHVFPLGFDHILFVLSLFFLNANVKSLIWQCTLFTLAHSVTLGLMASGKLTVNTNITEPLIALSIVFTSIENILKDKLSLCRMIIILIFGLIHGMGFATALSETGLPDAHFASTLVAFNLGVEFGQLAIILGAWYIMAKWIHQKSWYKTHVVYPASSLMACIALYWMIDRIIVIN